MFDLLIKGGTLPDATVADIAIKGDRIVDVGRVDGPAREIIDATGDLVSPPFVDPHFHLDATLSYGLPRLNVSGTLLEGIELWGELRAIATVDDMIARALRYCDWAAAMGLLVIYSYKDVNLLGGSHGLPELIATLVVVGLHLWKRQMLLSIAGGTVLYMLLLQFVF